MMNVESTHRSFYSIYEEARAVFSSLIDRRQEPVADSRDLTAAELSSYGWEPDVPQGQLFDPANCYIFKRVGDRPR